MTEEERKQLWADIGGAIAKSLEPMSPMNSYTVPWMEPQGQSLVHPHEMDVDGEPRLTPGQT